MSLLPSTAVRFSGKGSGALWDAECHRTNSTAERLAELASRASRRPAIHQRTESGGALSLWACRPGRRRVRPACVGEAEQSALYTFRHECRQCVQPPASPAERDGAPARVHTSCRARRRLSSDSVGARGGPSAARPRAAGAKTRTPSDRPCGRPTACDATGWDRAGIWRSGLDALRSRGRAEARLVPPLPVFSAARW